LKEKIQLNREVCKGCEEVFLRLGQCKHGSAIIYGKARSAVESLDFLIVENMQSLRWWSDIRTGHTSSEGEQRRFACGVLPSQETLIRGRRIQLTQLTLRRCCASAAELAVSSIRGTMVPFYP